MREYRVSEVERLNNILHKEVIKDGYSIRIQQEVCEEIIEKGYAIKEIDLTEYTTEQLKRVLEHLQHNCDLKYVLNPLYSADMICVITSLCLNGFILNFEDYNYEQLFSLVEMVTLYPANTKRVWQKITPKLSEKEIQVLCMRG